MKFETHIQSDHKMSSKKTPFKAKRMKKSLNYSTMMQGISDDLRDEIESPNVKRKRKVKSKGMKFLQLLK